MAGGLAYLATCTRPDITFAASSLARHFHYPTTRHILLAMRVLRYVNSSKNNGIFFISTRQPTSQSLRAAVDVDWGGDVDIRRSTIGFLTAVNGAPIFWRIKKQSLVTLSSAEAEYVALSTCSREVSWMRKLFREMASFSIWNNNSFLEATVIDNCDGYGSTS